MKTLSIEKLYSKEDIDRQSASYSQAAAEFEREFGIKPTAFFSAPGRTEVGGNHTDHNLGCVLAAGVSLDIIAAAAPTDDGFITIKSEGFPIDKIDLSDTDVKEADKNTSAALIRGMAAGFAQGGHAVGGFRAYCTSEVLQGSGLSSSAAYEVLVGTILNGLYNGGDVSDVEVAKIAQYAENVHFGKPSGLMDQMASSVGGLITIDFKDKDDPVIRSIDFDFAQSGHKLCIVDTKGDHADLTLDYAAIPAEMKAVAGVFGKRVLRELSREELIAESRQVRRKCGDRAYLRALHFFDENERVIEMTKALESGETEAFLRLVNESGMSSLCWLQNIFPCSQPQAQGLSVALYAAKRILGTKGACRVHGGGFAGTVQAFVPFELLDRFKAEMQMLFGDDCCHVLDIRNVGGAEIDMGGIV